MLRTSARLLSAACLLLAASGAAGDPITGTARLVDGDTLEVAGTTIRLHGIDAPERGQTCIRESGAPWDCGAAATERLAGLIDGAPVRCRAQDTDRYGRTVARCRARGRDVGAAMVRAGAAFAYRRYSTAYVGDEVAARAAGRGVWSGAAERPEIVRHGGGAGEPKAGTCRIKGNVSVNGRIFHRPGDAY